MMYLRVKLSIWLWRLFRADVLGPKPVREDSA